MNGVLGGRQKFMLKMSFRGGGEWTVSDLDDPAIRNANLSGSRRSIRRENTI